MILRKGLNPYRKLLRHLYTGCDLRWTAENCRNEFPRAYYVISHDTYVDDCMSGTEGLEQTRQATDELQVTWAKGGLRGIQFWKGSLFLGKNPPEKPKRGSGIGISRRIKLVSQRWFHKIKPSMNWILIKKSPRKKGITLELPPEVLTKRECISIVRKFLTL